MVEVGAAVAEAPVAYEASVNIPVYPVYAGQGGVLHHLPINIRALVEISWRVIFLRGALLAVLPQAHGDEDHEDQHHDAQHAAHHQVQHVAAPGRAGRRPRVASASRRAGRGAQVPDGVLGGSRNTLHFSLTDHHVTELALSPFVEALHFNIIGGFWLQMPDCVPLL